jgi:hypothetical protein
MLYSAIVELNWHHGDAKNHKEVMTTKSTLPVRLEEDYLTKKLRREMRGTYLTCFAIAASSGFLMFTLVKYWVSNATLG